MRVKDVNINIEEFEEKYFQNQGVVNEDSALLTHYLHNYRNGIKKFYEKEALVAFDKLVEYKQKKENIEAYIEKLLFL